MATGEIGRNLTFPIFNSDGTAFNDLVLHKATYDSVVMSLGDKITGDVYYRGTDLAVTMGEYIEYDGVRFVLVSPPTIVREGMVSDNSELKGLTKYSFTFYHPMYMLNNFPFSDIAVTTAQSKYLSQNKSFSWIGNLTDFVAKINKNLEGTQWYCDISSAISANDRNKLSEVIAFDKNTIADALKKGYETWEFPYIISKINHGEPQYSSGKRFLIRFGLPTTEITVDGSPFVFEYGQGVGLKNNSRTPRNNKIVTRLAGYGSEDNIPYGYPQIRWYGDQSWDYTVENNPSAANSYPIYDGILGGQKVRLIKHPFTRTHLMPSVYVNSLFNKVSPYISGGVQNPNYNPNTELKDYYDADNTYPNPIVQDAPSYEIHEFGDIKPELQSRQVSAIGTYDNNYMESVTMSDFLDILDDFITQSQYDVEKTEIKKIKDGIETHDSDSGSVLPPVSSVDARLYSCKWSYHKDDDFAYVKYESNGQNFEYTVRLSNSMPSPDWDDTMDDDGNYVQSYFTMTLPALGFDLYACAAITQQMSINMRSGACIGCTFPVAVDWEDYKRNFYDENGDFDPVIGTGHPRNGDKYPNSTSSAITVVVQKETSTFGTLMPNIYQKPSAGDDFVILGISLPSTYVTSAEERLDDDMKQYMRDNNVYYFDYPFKFDEAFLATHTDILQQMKPNVVVRFKYNGETLALYIKQMSIKFGDKPLPEYNITLTDDVEIVLNDIGKVSEEVSNLRILMGEGGGGGGLNDNRYLRKDKDDTAAGLIRLIKGLQVGEQFVTGLLGEGGIFRKDADGTTYLECDKMYVRMKAYFDTVEVRRFIHSGGNRIASAAGIKCSRVEWLTSGGVVTDNINNVEKFRCYFRANDDGKQITNDFEANDLAYCKETNINVSQGLSQRFYWRKVVGVSSSVNADGEHYIDISKSDCLSGSDYPLAQDDIIQLGNTTDTTRQGAIVEYVSGEDAPSYQIYQGINTYSLENKNYVSLGYKSDTGRAYMNVYGDFYFGDRPASGQTEGSSFIRYNQETGELEVKANVDFTHPESTYGTENLDDFIAAITQNIGNIQNQVDGNIESWFYDYMPVAVDATGAPLNKIPLVINNGSPVHPYYDWYTIDGGGTAHEVRTEREKHLGDTFYDNSSGYAFRFTLNSSTNAFEWTIIEDSAVIKALADAAKAQDTADHKRRAFVLPATIGGVTYNYPYPPYDVGDLWLNAKYPYNYDGVTDAENNKYNNDVLRCITSQDANGSFSISHWVLASKYTDDTVVNDFIQNEYAPFVQNIQSQVDKKAETWYQDNDPSSAWTDADSKKEHVGDIWYDTSQNGGQKTYIWKDFGTSANPRYAWAEQAVPKSVFDTIDGKCALYVSWNGWINAQNQNLLQVKDLLIPSADITQTIGGVTYNYKKDKVYRCVDSSTPVFREIEYTDDTTVNNIITRYGNILGITPTAQNVGEALGYLRQVLGGNTQVDGGLILSHLIALKDGNQVMSGMNGTLISTLANPLKTPAAWYGGEMVDYERLSDAQKAQGWSVHHWARSLFRFDGSGYLATGNVSWDEDGVVTIKNLTTLYDSNNEDVLNKVASLTGAFHFSTRGSGSSTVTYINPQMMFDHIRLSHESNYGFNGLDVLNRNEMDARYVRLDFFNALFQAYSSETISDQNKIDPTSWTAQTTVNNLKILVGAWTDQYLSAKGLNNSGSGGSGVSLNEPLNGINTANIGAPSTSGQAIVWNGSAWVYSIYTTLRAAGLYSAGTIASYGNFTSTQGDFIASAGHGFKVTGSDNTSVLLAGGGTKPLSEIGSAYTLPAATAAALGGLKVNQSYGQAVTVQSSGNVSTSNYGLQIDSNGMGFVYVPCLPLNGGTLTGDLNTNSNIKITGYNNRVFGLIQTKSDDNSGHVGDNIDVGWNWTNVDGSGAFFRSSDADGSFGFYARKGSSTTQLVGTPAGSLKWGGNEIATQTWVNSQGFITSATDTKNTTGGDNLGSKLFLVGMTAQTTNNGNSRTYTNSNCYTSGGYLYSGGLKVATESWVSDQHYITGYTDTKNTAGTTNLASIKLFIVGAASQAANPQTYSNSNCYVGSDNCLYSNGAKVATGTIPTKTSQLTNDSGYITSDSDTKNTAGATNLASTKLFIIGATAQNNNPVTYSNTNCYVDTDNCLYSNGSKVATGTIPTKTSQLTNDSGYLTSGDVVTTNTAQSIGAAKTFTATLTSSAGGSFTGGLRFYSICIECNSDGTPNSGRSGEINRYGSQNLHLQYDSDTGGVTMCRQKFVFSSTSSTSQLSSNNNNFSFLVGTGTPYIDKAWQVTSDMRKKDIARYINLDISRIADAPVFDFTWKNDITKQLTLGSSAQYWQSVFPNAIRQTPDGYLGMDYSSIALASAVLTARKVVDHEKRIRLLEVENEALRREIDQLKKAA